MKKIISFILFVVSVLTFTFMSVSVSGCVKKVDRTSYKINCTLEDDSLYGNEEVTFFNNTANTFKELKFNLFGNAFRKDAKYRPVNSQYTSKAYYNGINYGGMKINNVLSGNEKMEYSVGGEDENILIVKLNEEIFPDESVTITIDFTLNLCKVVARTGINEKAINLGNFYPVLCGIDKGNFYECVYYSNGDPFYSDVADYDVKLKANSGYVVASGGEFVEKREEGNDTIWNFKIEKARSFAFVISKYFKVLTGKHKDTKINYYYYSDENPEKSLETAINAMTLFTEKFGEYVYKSYSVCETQFVQGGMEYPGLVMISDNLKDVPYQEVIVHETAHQWWQTAVGNNEIKYGFLDEGLAEYSVVIYYENHPEYGFTRESLLKSSLDTFRVFCSVYDKLMGKVNTEMLRPLKDFSSEYEYVNISYIKPSIMYEYLRTTTGDNLFFSALKRYYKNYKFRNAEPCDLVGSFEKAGADTNSFFESFFNGKVIL